jgi:hypothetical protein
MLGRNACAKSYLECFEQACDHEGDICDKLKPAVSLVQVCLPLFRARV